MYWSAPKKGIIISAAVVVDTFLPVALKAI